MLSSRPLILGHRGAPLEAPENTLRSLALALEQGADGVELDVRLSRDGMPVVIHDPELERAFGVAGRVADQAWSALERLTGARLPSFEQAAAWAAARGAWLNVEIKTAGAEEATLGILERMDLFGRTFLSSFDAGVVRRLRELRPDARRFLLTNRWDDAAREGVRSSDAHGVCLRVDAATADALAELAALGLPVVVWTVDDPARMRELLQAGVAALISNRPGAAAAARAELERRPPDAGTFT